MTDREKPKAIGEGVLTSSNPTLSQALASRRRGDNHHSKKIETRERLSEAGAVFSFRKDQYSLGQPPGRKGRAQDS